MLSKRTLRRMSAGLGLVLLAAVLIAATTLAADKETMAGKDKAPGKAEAVAEDTYPLETCVVSGGKLGAMGDAVIYNHEGREIRFCCQGCVKQFQKDPQKYLMKLDQAIIERDMPNYPLETCLVTGKSLMGEKVEPINFIYHDRLVRLYDDAAVKTFMKEPDLYLAKLDEAQAKHNMQMMENAEMMEGMQGMKHMTTGQMGAAGETKAQGSCGGH